MNKELRHRAPASTNKISTLIGSMRSVTLDPLWLDLAPRSLVQRFFHFLRVTNSQDSFSFSIFFLLASSFTRTCPAVLEIETREKGIVDGQLLSCTFLSIQPLLCRKRHRRLISSLHKAQSTDSSENRSTGIQQSTTRLLLRRSQEQPGESPLLG